MLHILRKALLVFLEKDDDNSLSKLADTKKLIENERLKLTASLCNTISGATIVVGFVTPFVNEMNGALPMSAGPSPWFVPLWFATGAFLHFLGRYLLKGVKS